MENKYKKDFPIFSEKENEGLVYLDSAATTQKPKCVLEKIREFYEKDNANPLRGLYGLSARATDAYEEARETVAGFINAKSVETIFTRNATESLNMVAYTWGMENVSEGDEIALPITEHHSNILPWQMLAKRKGAKLVFLEPDKRTGEFSDEELSKINEKTKIVAIAEVSNVLGITHPVKKIANIAHKNGAICVVDGAQSVPHSKVDVKNLDADFFAFSGHKICGPMGIGVLYGKKELLEKTEPFLRGGEMIEYVSRENATWAELPHKFEAGTVNAAGAIGLSEAIKYIKSIGMENIVDNDNRLTSLLMQKMKEIPHVCILGNEDSAKHSGIVTFTVDGVHPHDIATLLDTEKIAIRAGHHCAQPLGAYLSLPATARVSVYIYNDENDVERFSKAIKGIRKMSGYKD